MVDKAGHLHAPGNSFGNPGTWGETTVGHPFFSFGGESTIKGTTVVLVYSRALAGGPLIGKHFFFF